MLGIKNGKKEHLLNRLISVLIRLGGNLKFIGIEFWSSVISVNLVAGVVCSWLNYEPEKPPLIYNYVLID